MAFIRTKRLKGRDYAYLVESVWDPEKKASRQHTIKYLGPAEKVKLEDVPEEYRNDKVRAFILRNSVLAAHRRARFIADLRDRLLTSILDGNVPRTKAATAEGMKSLGVDQLYLHVITQVMYTVGEMWARRDIYVSHEHLATNTMTQAVTDLNATIRWTGRKRGTAIVCTPDGERHKFAAEVLRGLLLNRGFETLDISDSAPTDSIVAFVESRQPDVVLVSVTMTEHLPMAGRLLSAIQRAVPEARVVVGGQGVMEGGLERIPEGVLIGRPDTLEALDHLAAGHGLRGG